MDDNGAPKVDLISPEDSQPTRSSRNGWSGLVGAKVRGSSVAAGEADRGIIGGGTLGSMRPAGGADLCWRLAKGIGAGLIGAAVVGLGAVLVDASAPVPVTVAGAAVLAGAI